MPTYLYQCKDCNETYEELWMTFQEAEEFEPKYLTDTKCPKCNSTNKVKMMSSPMVNFLGDGWTGKKTIGPAGSQTRHQNSTAALKDHAARIEDEAKGLTSKDLYGDVSNDLLKSDE